MLIVPLLDIMCRFLVFSHRQIVLIYHEKLHGAFYTSLKESGHFGHWPVIRNIPRGSAWAYHVLPVLDISSCYRIISHLEILFRLHAKLHYTLIVLDISCRLCLVTHAQLRSKLQVHSICITPTRQQIEHITIREEFGIGCTYKICPSRFYCVSCLIVVYP